MPLASSEAPLSHAGDAPQGNYPECPLHAWALSAVRNAAWLVWEHGALRGDGASQHGQVTKQSRNKTKRGSQLAGTAVGLTFGVPPRAVSLSEGGRPGSWEGLRVTGHAAWGEADNRLEK